MSQWVTKRVLTVVTLSCILFGALAAPKVSNAGCYHDIYSSVTFCTTEAEARQVCEMACANYPGALPCGCFCDNFGGNTFGAYTYVNTAYGCTEEITGVGWMYNIGSAYFSDPCKNEAEVCCNGVDDNCNGQVDEGCDMCQCDPCACMCCDGTGSGGDGSGGPASFF